MNSLASPASFLPCTLCPLPLNFCMCLVSHFRHVGSSGETSVRSVSVLVQRHPDCDC